MTTVEHRPSRRADCSGCELDQLDALLHAMRRRYLSACRRRDEAERDVDRAADAIIAISDRYRALRAPA